MVKAIGKVVKASQQNEKRYSIICDDLIVRLGCLWLSRPIDIDLKLHVQNRTKRSLYRRHLMVVV